VTAEVTEVLRALFPPGVEVEAARPEDVEGRLFPEEEALIANAIAKRRLVFRGGRILARRALARLGVVESPLPAKNRRPVWPEGIVGSISHADGCCVVAVARRGEIVGIGVDVEVDGAVTERILSHIATPEERDWLAGCDDLPRWATVLFSAKEAFYKSLAPIHPQFVGFHDVRVEIGMEGTFRVIPLDETVRAPIAGLGVSGRWRREGGWAFAGVVVRSAPPDRL
jgi:4'-phosphopantetheinyl transferase EntD